MWDKLGKWAGAVKTILYMAGLLVAGFVGAIGYGVGIAQEAGREAAQAEIEPWTAKFEMDFERNRREEDRQLWRDCLDYNYSDLDPAVRRRMCDDEMEWRADIYYPWEDTCINIRANAMAADSTAVCPEEPEYKPDGGP